MFLRIEWKLMNSLVPSVEITRRHDRMVGCGWTHGGGGHYLSWYNHGDGFNAPDRRGNGDLVEASDLTAIDIAAAFGHESRPALGDRGLEGSDVVEVGKIVVDLIVTYYCVTLWTKEKTNYCLYTLKWIWITGQGSDSVNDIFKVTLYMTSKIKLNKGLGMVYKYNIVKTGLSFDIESHTPWKNSGADQVRTKS